LLQKHGHKPIVIVGGGTTKVGDPSGKDEARKMLSGEDIANNMEGIKKQLSQFLKFGENPSDAIMVNNADWLDSLKYTDFLRDYGRHFSINRMLTFDSVKIRLEREQNLSFLEFNYMLLQAYDFTVLNKKYNCRLQVGGSDQWGNIVNGIELGRKLQLPELFGLTNPLLTTASGAKMGKSVSGAVWLGEDMLSPYEYYQYWRNVEDADAIKFLKLFTDLSLNEIAKLENLQGAEINEAKKILAFEATKLCHGKEKARSAEETAKQVFEQNILSENLPTIYLTREELENGIAAFELFHKAGLVSSGGEARRLIRGKGAKINDVTIENENQNITIDIFNDEAIKLSSGKKNHAIVKLN
ncbi:MAG: tyrosine--tRNA ligase, partial [Alphaproteobacteria bacterium]